jgi:hypothetical protein
MIPGQRVVGSIGVSKLIEGLTPVDPRFLADFEREMTDQAIPEIVQASLERLRLAVESRSRWLGQQ